MRYLRMTKSTRLAACANAIATGGALVALILALGPQSGVHMKPVVTLAAAATEGLRGTRCPPTFANPAVTIARSLSDIFAGIRPVDAPGFIIAQLAGLALALPLLHRTEGRRP